MQKKHRNKARRAKTGMTGKAGKAGTQGTADRPENTGIAGKVDTLTPEQRTAKRLRDRKYRAKKRAAACAAEHAAKDAKVTDAAEPADCTRPKRSCGASRSHGSHSCRKCGGCSGDGKSFVQTDVTKSAPSAADAQDVFSLIGRIVLGELVKSGVPSASKNSPCPVQVERGVTRQEITLPDGRTAAVMVVDGDEVDPLSPHSPIPWPVRRHLLLRRMAQEISDIVDSHLGQS
jgi:hypothetical protein